MKARTLCIKSVGVALAGVSCLFVLALTYFEVIGRSNGPHGQSAEVETFSISRPIEFPVIEVLDLRIEKLELIESRVVAIMRLTYLGDPKRTQCPEMDFVEIDVRNLPWRGNRTDLFEIRGVPEQFAARKSGYPCCLMVYPETHWQRLAPGQSIRQARDVSEFFNYGAVKYNLDEVAKHVNDFTVQGCVRCFVDDKECFGLAVSQKAKQDQTIHSNAKVFDLPKDGRSFTQRIDDIGLPVLREFDFRIERLQQDQGRIYASVRLTYLSNPACAYCDELNSVEIAQRPSLLKLQNDNFCRVRGIPSEFARLGVVIIDEDGMLPQERIGFKRRSRFVPIFGYSKSWDIDVSNHLNLQKANTRFDEFVNRAGEIQIQAQVSYRCGQTQKGGLISTH